MTAVPFLDLAAQYRGIAEEIDAAIGAVLRRCDFVLGADVGAFEEEFARYCQTGHAVGVDTGMSALELGMRAMGIGPGDEVLTPANSFIASSSAISHTGATPVWVDVDPVGYHLDLDAADRLVTARTRAIMVVHLYGQPQDMDAVAAFARRHGIEVIEDACQAHGARWRGRRVGGLGRFAAFSFYPGKNLGGYGDGGALTTDDPKLVETLRMMRNYGQRRKYEHVTLAWNRRLDALQAAVLRVKLRHLDGWNAARRRAAARYDERLSGTGVVCPSVVEGAEHVYHCYVIRVPERRDELMAYLAERGIAANLHYPVPIHRQECYADRGFGPGSFPVSEDVAGRLLSLPLSAEHTDEQLDRVAEAVRAFAGRHGWA